MKTTFRKTLLLLSLLSAFSLTACDGVDRTDAGISDNPSPVTDSGGNLVVKGVPVQQKSLVSIVIVATNEDPVITDETALGTVLQLAGTIINPQGTGLDDGEWAVELPANCSQSDDDKQASQPSELEYLLTYKLRCEGQYVFSLSVLDQQTDELVKETFKLNVTESAEHIINIEPIVRPLKDFSIQLDASKTVAAHDEKLDFLWNLTSPAGCVDSLEDPSMQATSFIPSCVGAYKIGLLVKDSISEQQKEISFQVGQALIVNMNVRAAGAFPFGTVVDLHLEESSIPLGVSKEQLTYNLEATPAAGFTMPTITFNAPQEAFRVDPAEAHAEYSLKGYVTFEGVAGESVTGEIKVANNAPTLSLSMDYMSGFDLGDSVALTATVADVDGDALSCRGWLDSNDAGLSFVETVSAANGKCIFNVPTSGASHAALWTLNVKVEDPFGASAEASQGFHPDNNGPVIASIKRISSAKIPYSCTDNGGCKTDPFIVEVAVDDDYDDFNDLTHSFKLKSNFGGRYSLTRTQIADSQLFRIVISRSNKGPMLQNYELLYIVGDTGGFDDQNPLSGSKQLNLPKSQIQNVAPTFSGEVSNIKPGFYIKDTELITNYYKYATSIRITINFDDPEENLRYSWNSLFFDYNCLPGFFGPSCLPEISTVSGLFLTPSVVAKLKHIEGNEYRFSLKAKTKELFEKEYKWKFGIKDNEGSFVKSNNVTIKLTTKGFRYPLPRPFPRPSPRPF